MATTTRAVARWREKVGTAIAGRPSSSPYRVIYGDPHTTPSYNPHFRDYTSYLQAVKKVPWVYACCKAIAYNVANAEAALYKRVPNGEPERVENDMFLTLWNQPNRFRNGFSFRERLCFDLELTGNFFTSLEEWSWLGLPTAMYRLRPDLVTITPDPDELVAEYVYGQGRKKIHYAPGEVLHISYPNPEDELYGMGVIEAAEYRMNSARAMGQHEATFWENGAKITGVLQSDQKLPDPQFKRLQQTFAKFIRGSGFATLILEGGVKYQAISASPARLGLVELEKMSREEILGLFGVPPTKVGIIDSANYKALAADEAFWVEKIDPTLTRIEVSVQPLVDLFHPSVAPGTYFLKYEEIDFKGDATRLENVARMSSTKTRTLNEMRDYEGLDALPNGDIIIFEAQNFYFDAKKGEFTPIVAPKAQNPALEAHQEAGKPLLSPGKKTADGMVPIEMELDHVGEDGQLYYRVKANPYRLETGHFAHPFADIYPHQLPRVTTDAGTKVQCPGLTPGHHEKRPGVPWYSVMLARACERDGYTRAVAQQMLAHDAYRGPFRRQAETREEALAQLRRASVDRYGHPYAAMAPGVNLTDVKFSRRDAQDAVVAVRDQLIAWADEHGRAQVARAFRSLRDAALRRAERTKKAELRPEAIVDAGEAQDALSAALVEIYERAADAGYDAAEAVQLAINPTEEAIRRIQGELAGRLPGILETTRAQIGEQIAEGLRRSYSARQIAHGYPAEEYGGIAQVFERAETSRAEMIARTEATHAFNRYNVAALGAAGVEHVQVHDGTEFDEPCRERNGRIVPINEAAEMELNHPHCRLYFSPVNRASDREAETEPDGGGKMWTPTSVKFNPYHGEHGHFAHGQGGHVPGGTETGAAASREFLERGGGEITIKPGMTDEESGRRWQKQKAAWEAGTERVADRVMANPQDAALFEDRAHVKWLMASVYGGWGGGNNSGATIAMQTSIAKQYKMPEKAMKHLSDETDWAMKLGEHETKEWGPQYDAVMRHVHAETQAQFAARGITEVTLYRGVSFSRAPEWAKGKNPSYDMSESFPISSWSSDKEMARLFATERGGGKNGYILTITTPVRNVLGTAHSGMGQLEQAEYAVLNNTGTASVERT